MLLYSSGKGNNVSRAWFLYLKVVISSILSILFSWTRCIRSCVICRAYLVHTLEYIAVFPHHPKKLLLIKKIIIWCIITIGVQISYFEDYAKLFNWLLVWKLGSYHVTKERGISPSSSIIYRQNFVGKLNMYNCFWINLILLNTFNLSLIN